MCLLLCLTGYSGNRKKTCHVLSKWKNSEKKELFLDLTWLDRTRVNIWQNSSQVGKLHDVEKSSHTDRWRQWHPTNQDGVSKGVQIMKVTETEGSHCPKQEEKLQKRYKIRKKSQVKTKISAIVAWKLRRGRTNQGTSDQAGRKWLVESQNMKINKLEPEPNKAKRRQTSDCQGASGDIQKMAAKTVKMS